MERIAKLVAEAISGSTPCGAGMYYAPRELEDSLQIRGFRTSLTGAYTMASAGRIRKVGGITGKNLQRKEIDEYLGEIDIPGEVKELRQEGAKLQGNRGAYLTGLATCLEVMWDLAMEALAKGAPVSYARCVEASTGRAPEQSKPQAKREKVAELLRSAGYAVEGEEAIQKAVDAWRADRLVPMASVRALGNAVIAV